MTKKLTENILQTIEENEISPKSHIFFICKKVALVVLLLLSIIFGALTVAAIMFITINNHWDVVSYIAAKNPFFIFTSIPFLWLLVTAILIYGMCKEIRHMKGGYKYPISLIVSGTMAVTLLGGIILYSLGAGHTVDRAAGKLPGYRSMEVKQQELWSHPEKGFLAGKVTSTSSDIIIVTDFNENVWTVTYATSHAPVINRIPQGAPIRILGIDTGDETYFACAVLPWKKEIIQEKGPKGKNERKLFIMRSKECEAQFPHIRTQPSR